MEFITLQFGPELGIGQSASRIPVLRRNGPSASPRLPTHTDFSALSGKTVLIVADEDNLRIGTTDHGLRLSFDLLLRKLSGTARRVSPWAVITGRADDARRETYLLHRGWRVLKIPRETVMTVDGPRTKSNADMDICFLAGNLITNDFYDATVIASGDGDLCIAIGRGIRRARPAQEILTASIPRSTSHRILAANNPLFDGNILLGLDLMRQAEKTHAITAIKSGPVNDSLLQGENHRARFDLGAAETARNGSLHLGKH